MKLITHINYLILILVFNLCAIPNSLIAQDNANQKREYVTKKMNKRLIIDGIFDESVWNKVEWSSDFTTKAHKVEDRYDTAFKIIYDEKYLYVAVKCLDAKPDSIPLFPSPRDNSSNDWVEIDFDSNYDKKSGYAFVVSPYGVRTDMHITGDDENFDDRWHPKWLVKTNLHKNGWNAEMKIPFDQMEISHENEYWGIQITRHITRKEEYSNWQPMPKGAKGWVSQFGHLIGISSVEGKKNDTSDYLPNIDIAINQLQDDIKVLKTTLENVYPDLYWFSKKETMDSLFKSISNSITQPLTEFEFYEKLTPILNAMGDGHSWIRPSRNYINYLYETNKMLPLGVKIVDQSIYVTKNFSHSDEIEKGMQITAINGIKSAELLAKALNYISADGYNTTWKTDRISNDFSFYLNYVIGSQNTFSLRVISPKTKEEKSLVANGLLEKDWVRNTLPVSDINYRKDNWNYHLLNDSVGYLSVNTFARGKRFRNYMDEIFQKINKDGVSHLIIDVRDNYGGNDSNGKHLFSYLAKNPFFYHKRYEVNRKLPEETVEFFDCCISTEEIDFLKVVSQVGSDGRRIIYDYEKTGYDNPDDKIEPQKNAFQGDVYLLVNGGSFSVTSDFASKVHEMQRGIIIGEETGGGYYGNTSGINKLLILPHSKLRVNVNLIKYINDRDQSKHVFGRGLMPDYSVKPNGTDLSNGKDVELEYALNLIRKN